MLREDVVNIEDSVSSWLRTTDGPVFREDVVDMEDSAVESSTEPLSRLCKDGRSLKEDEMDRDSAADEADSDSDPFFALFLLNHISLPLNHSHLTHYH